MDIKQLGYIGIASRDTSAWRKFAGEYLGMTVVEAGADRIALRVDERGQRMLVEPADHDGLAFLGFELPRLEALHESLVALVRDGVAVTAGTATEARERCVSEFIWFRDPDGHRIELYHGAVLASEPLEPARLTGGFRTGELGVGHVALQTCRFEAMEKFYRRLLGFRLSDYIEASPFKATFLHVNARHHSLALIESEQSGIHHVMVEYNFMDDVGRLYDMALTQPGRVAVTLGRHTNDHVVSFYSRTPGGFMIETGWAGRTIDESDWKVDKLIGPSLWGHERSWLSVEAKVSASRQRQLAAERGLIAPTEANRTPGFNLNRICK